MKLFTGCPCPGRERRGQAGRSAAGARHERRRRSCTRRRAAAGWARAPSRRWDTGRSQATRTSRCIGHQKASGRSVSRTISTSAPDVNLKKARSPFAEKGLTPSAAITGPGSSAANATWSRIASGTLARRRSSASDGGSITDPLRGQPPGGLAYASAGVWPRRSTAVTRSGAVEQHVLDAPRARRPPVPEGSSASPRMRPRRRQARRRGPPRDSGGGGIEASAARPSLGIHGRQIARGATSDCGYDCLQSVSHWSRAPRLRGLPKRLPLALRARGAQAVAPCELLPRTSPQR